MRLRTRMLLAFGIVVLVPLALLAFGFRYEMTRRLTEDYQARVAAVADVIQEDLQRDSADIAARLTSVKTELLNDNDSRFRQAVAGAELYRTYLLDYAGSAMSVTGLSMLQIQDEDGRIISSGHFRNEHGRVETGLAEAVATTLKTAPGGVALVKTRLPDGDELLALVHSESFELGGRSFTLIGGTAVDESFLSRLARDRAIVVSLSYPGGGLSSAKVQGSAPIQAAGTEDVAVDGLDVPLIRIGLEGLPEVATA